MTAPLRIYYAAGPGNIVGTFRHWLDGEDDPGQVARTYSGQFYEACRELGAVGLAVSSNPRADSERRGAIEARNRPAARFGSGGLGYHVQMLWQAVRITTDCLRMRADAAVVSGGSTHLFLLAPLAMLGTRVVPSLHCVLHPKGQAPTGLAGLIHRANLAVLRRLAFRSLCVSRDVADQVGPDRPGAPPLTDVFIPTYRPEAFEGLAPADWRHRPFRVLYAGRIEGYKGVDHLLGIARRFRDEGRTDIEFDLCGDGGALDDLRRQVERSGLSGTFRCHGHCDRDLMRSMFERCQVLIVPTTTAFVEGFNKVVAEGVLSERPVITSSVCPALQTVREAVVEVPPDDERAYGDAVLRLADDEAFFESHRRACAELRPRFFDPERSWKTSLLRVLAAIAPPPHADAPRPRPEVSGAPRGPIQ